MTSFYRMVYQGDMNEFFMDARLLDFDFDDLRMVAKKALNTQVDKLEMVLNPENKSMYKIVAWKDDDGLFVSLNRDVDDFVEWVPVPLSIEDYIH